jgi:predicted nucleotidyltransferase component of viral defense system
MTKKGAKNHAASVKQRLLNLAGKTKEDFGLVLIRYSLERLLFRLSASAHRDQFVVKGATLFALWTGEPHRATRDLDLLAIGDSDLNRLRDMFRSLCNAPNDEDGLTFDEASVIVSRIKEDQEYEGVRIELVALLGTARVPVQVDVGFGDAITPGPSMTTFPTLLELPAPKMRTYPRETVVAEKLHAMVVLGMVNSRMKDFFDVWTLARRFEFEGATLSKAVIATFKRRATAVPDRLPLALTPDFLGDSTKQKQWAAFSRRTRPTEGPDTLTKAGVLLVPFAEPVLVSAASGKALRSTWVAGGPWSDR